MADPATPYLLTLTAQIVASHVAGNKVPLNDVPALTNDVYSALTRVNAPLVATHSREPAVPIKRSIQHDYLVCLEDGAHVQLLTRYLRRFDLTPEAYRAKWRLPTDYPMSAPAAAARRSAVAKQIGLGNARHTAEQSAPKAPHGPIEVEEPTVPTRESAHTAVSVFAKFPGGEIPAEATPAATDAGKPGRKQFGQQSMRVGRRR